MKRGSLLLLLVIYAKIVLFATVTEFDYTEKQKALKQVTEFCSLLVQWSNGQRTLDTRIYSLCSGNDCSAFDDVSTNKETTLRNYLLGIQKKYPQSLSMEITKPTLSKSNIYLDASADIYIGEDITEFNVSDIAPKIEIIAVEDTGKVYMTFEVTQKTAQTSMNKKIVYDVESGKITAFVNGNGTYISYLNGVSLFLNGDFRNAIPQFNYASNNIRSSLKRKSLLLAGLIYARLGDYQSAISTLGDAKIDFWKSYFEGELSFKNKNYTNATRAFSHCEEIIKGRSDYNDYKAYISYCIGISYLYNNNNRNAVIYLKKSASEGYWQSGFYLYHFRLMSKISNADLSYDEMIEWLKVTARNRHRIAYFDYAVYKEYVENKKTQAIYWYYRALYPWFEDPIAFACLGKMLIEAKNTQLPKLGLNYLKRSTHGDFGKYLNAYKDRINLLTGNTFWIKSQSDVQSYTKVSQVMAHLHNLT